jgi:hypothetical protein
VSAEFCTYLDRHYLDRGLALYESLHQHCSRFRLWVLCMDAPSYDALTRLDLPNVRPMPVEMLEDADHELKRARDDRSLVEYYFTCTPCLPLFVFNHAPEVDLLTYLDADLFFFADPRPLFDEIGGHSVAVIEHRFPSHLKRLERAGRYNVGWVSFRRDEDGLACLRLWRQQCLDWCHDYPEDGRYADQKYLDAWPTRFQNVVTLEHKGANLAPWNLANYRISKSAGHVWVDEQPLIFFHFHGLTELRRWVYDTKLGWYGVTPSPLIAHDIYARYVDALVRARRALSESGHALVTRADLRHAGRSSVRLSRVWVDALAGRYMVILNGHVISAGR